jgi:hypothetical protein
MNTSLILNVYHRSLIFPESKLRVDQLTFFCCRLMLLFPFSKCVMLPSSDDAFVQVRDAFVH